MILNGQLASGEVWAGFDDSRIRPGEGSKQEAWQTAWKEADISKMTRPKTG